MIAKEKVVHSPAPWKVFDGGTDDSLFVESIGSVCKVARKGPDLRNRELEWANARLIAAAPELLEALRQMVLLFDDCRAGCLLLARADHAPMTNGDQEIIGKAFIAAESAIRKAKGE